MFYSEDPVFKYRPQTTTWLLDPKYDLSEGLRNESLGEWSRQFAKDGEVLDLSAGYGEMALTLASVSQVIAIEANRDVYYALCGNIFLNNWTPKISAHMSLEEVQLKDKVIKFIYGSIEQVSKSKVKECIFKDLPNLVVGGQELEITNFLLTLTTPTEGELYNMVPVDGYSNHWLLIKKK